MCVRERERGSHSRMMLAWINGEIRIGLEAQKERRQIEREREKLPKHEE